MSHLGTDFDCADDITDDWALAASPELAFIQALYRRLLLRRNALFYVPGYGLGAYQLLLDTGLTEQDIKTRISIELKKDERVRAVSVTGSIDDLSVAVTPYGSSSALEHTLTIDAVAGVIAITES